MSRGASEYGDLRQRFGGAALITGASSGFGEHFAHTLAEAGMDVALVARRVEKLEALAAEIRERHGVQALVIGQDLCAPDAADRVQEALRTAELEVGLLINNAGFGSYGRFETLDEATEARMVDLNCRVPLVLARRFAPGMVARGRGGILFVASMASFQPVPYLATYAATKAFDLSIAEALWAELGPLGVDVLALCPGYVETGFQAVAGLETMPIHGQVVSVEQVIHAGIRALGRTSSIVPGGRNKLLSQMPRILPRGFIVKAAGRVYRPKERPAPSAPTPGDAGADDGGFQRDVCRLLLAFFSVVLIDVIVISLMTGRLRFWFPNWLDAQWETRPDAWVIYSQSYIAGILFIPLLLSSVDRSFLRRRWSTSARTLLWGVALSAFAFILWWKGNLMADHDKELEALGWVALTGLVYGLIVVAEGLPRRIAGLSRRGLMVKLLTGVSGFFLVMAVLDPVFQIGVQGLAWSSGLTIEVAFFIPAGILLAFVARRLGRAERG